MREFQINPLSILGSRRLDFLPPHFVTTTFKSMMRIDAIDWIDQHLKGRYFFGTLTKLDNERIHQYEAVAFEEPHELTLFLLGYNQK